MAIESKQQSDVSDISVAIIYPGNRVKKMSVPLLESQMNVDVDPPNPYERDIVVADNADRNLGTEVLKNPFTDSKLVYRMRGDVFHELDLWGMNPIKEWVARNIVLPRVDGTIAVTEWLADKYTEKTGIKSGSAGLWKDVSEWPKINHTERKLGLITLTNFNYWKKVNPIIEYAPTVDDVLGQVGGTWRVCGNGTHTETTKESLESYENIEFAGFVDAKEALGNSNVMFHPSNLDGQPNSILEGLASNLPVITNDFRAFTEFEGPIEVVENSRKLRVVLKELTNPELRRSYGERGVSYMEANHTPEAIAKDYETYFHNLLNHEQD